MRVALAPIIALFSLTLTLAVAGAANAQVPQIPAALPYSDAFSDLAPLPFDGVWRFAENHRKYRVSGGAFIAEHDYVDMFVFKVMADMVVAANFEQNEDGGYTGEDLGYKIPWTIEPATKGLRITAHTLLGPIVFNARPISIDDPEAYAAFTRGDSVASANTRSDDAASDDEECEYYQKTPEGFVCAE